VIKAEFSASLLSHDPSEITLIWWFDTQETFTIIISELQQYYCASRDIFFLQN